MPKFKVSRSFTDKAGRAWNAGENYTGPNADEEVQSGNVAADTSQPSGQSDQHRRSMGAERVSPPPGGFTETSKK